MRRDELDNLLKEKDLYFHGEPEQFDRKRLIKEIENCRCDGFALELGEITPGLNTAASPVIGMNGSPIGTHISDLLCQKSHIKYTGTLFMKHQGGHYRQVRLHID